MVLTKKQIIDKSKYLITKYKYDKIFLCTEEKEIFEPEPTEPDVEGEEEEENQDQD